MFIVYKLTCFNTGKSYIGYSKRSLMCRWNGHCKRSRAGVKSKLYNAIRKYGERSFSQEILKEVETQKEACSAEIELIARYQTQKLGYNITGGGDGGNTSAKRTPEWNKHISDALKGIPKSAEHKANLCGPRPSICGKNNPFYGKTHSEDTKKKIGNRPYATGKNHYLYGKPTATSFKPGFEHPRSHPVNINGTKYGSLSLAAKALGMTRPKLQRWLASGKFIPPAQFLQGTPSTLTKQAFSEPSSPQPVQLIPE